MEQLPRVIDSEHIFEGRVFGVRRDLVRFASNHEVRLDIVEHPGSFAILARPSAGAIVLVRQYRHPAHAYLWEIPAGKAEAGESALEGAARELAEETGYRATTLRELAAVYMTPGFCEERLHLVLADDLTPGPTDLDEDEAIEVRVVTITDAQAMVVRGEIVDAKTVLALLYLAARAGEPTHLLPGDG